MTETKTLNPVSFIQPTDCGVWLLIDKLLETRHEELARKVWNGQKKSPVKVYPPSKKDAEAFAEKLIEAAKKSANQENAFPFYKQSAQALLTSLDSLSQNVGAKAPGWLETYNKFNSSFSRFAKLHLQQKMGLDFCK